MAKTFDVIIIGGGIMGTATAYQLANRGVKVVLLEKTHLAAGSTAYTCGVIRQLYSVETLARMAFRALKVWESFDEIVGGEVGLQRCGILWVAGIEHAEDITVNAKMLHSIGARADILDSETVREMAPYLRSDDIEVGIFEPDGAVADGSLACNAFANRARALGADIRQGVEVTRIRTFGKMVVGVDTQDGSIDAPVVINTAGPWGPALARSVGLQIPAEPSRHQVVSFKQPADFENPGHPAIADFINSFYVRPDTGGLTNAGDLEDDISDVVHNPDSYNTKADRSFIEKMVERSTRRIPALELGSVHSGWAGMYTVTPDWKPIIDKIEELQGLIVGLGFSGSGFKMGPVAGEMLADLATGDQQCPIDSSVFRLKRFEEGEEILGDYGFSIIS